MVSDTTTIIGDGAMATTGVSTTERVPHEPLTHHKVEFKGRGAEYFRIWIVNFFLSVITLGIYSAWAKVRRQRYFYGNTFVDGHNFEYHALPKRILIGRIIAVGIIVGLNILSSLHPALAAVSLVFLFVFPWLILHSIRFNARVTSYRNVHFNFEGGSYLRALWVFGIMPMFAVLSLGLLLPVSARLAARFVGDGLRYGNVRFKSDPKLGPLYSNYFLAMLFGIAIFFLVVGVLLIFQELAPTEYLARLKPLDKLEWSVEYIGQILISLSFVFFVWIFAFVAFTVPSAFMSAGNRNVIFKATRIDGQHFLSSSLSRLKYAWIVFSNLFLTIFSFGLLYSWCTVRLWRYKVENTALLTSDSLDNFIAERIEAGSAFGAEYLDIDGFDFGF